MTLIKPKVDLMNVFRELGPEWNDLELKLRLHIGDVDVDDIDSSDPYANLEIQYGIGMSDFDFTTGRPRPISSVKTFQGFYPVGEPLMPRSIEIKANGHAYPTEILQGRNITPVELWGIVRSQINKDLDGFLARGYRFKHIGGFRNAKGNWPPGSCVYDGTIDADEFSLSINNVPQ